mgnify:FL=1
MKNKSLFYLLFTFLAFSYTLYAQECGFDENEKLDKSEKKLDWFVKKLKKQGLVITNDKNDIPLKVKEQLDCYTNGFDLANPGEKYQGGCIVEEDVPSRELPLLAKTKEYLIISYNTYALGSSGHDIWIKYDETGITDFWSGSNMARFLLASRFELIKYIEETESINKNKYRYINNNN